MSNVTAFETDRCATKPYVLLISTHISETYRQKIASCYIEKAGSLNWQMFESTKGFAHVQTLYNP